MKKYLKEILIVIVGIVIFAVGYEAWNDFKRSPFEKIVYKGCTDERKYSLNICACYAEKLDKKISNQGKVVLTKFIEGMNKNVNALKNMSENPEIFKYMPEMTSAIEFCQKNK